MSLNQKLARFLLVVGMAAGLLLAVFQPVCADGPSIPSYIIQDGKHVPAPTGYVQTTAMGGDGQAVGSFKDPMDLFLDSATGNLVVADTGNNRVVVLDKQGKFLLEIGGEKAGLKDPQGVFVDQNGSIGWQIRVINVWWFSIRMAVLKRRIPNRTLFTWKMLISPPANWWSISAALSTW